MALHHYSELRKLSVADMIELIKVHLRKLGGDGLENRTDIESRNGFYYLNFTSKDMKKYPLLKDWENCALRRYNLTALFSRIEKPENYR